MDNRLRNGFLAGLAGGLAMNAFSLTDYYLTQDIKLTFLDWSAVMLYGQRTQSLLGNVFALVTQVLFTSFLGIVFSYIILVVKDGGYVFKGWYYGVICWLTIYGVDILLKLHDLNRIPVRTAISNFIGSPLFGVTLGYVLLKLDLWQAGKNREPSIRSKFQDRVVPAPIRKKLKP